MSAGCNSCCCIHSRIWIHIALLLFAVAVIHHVFFVVFKVVCHSHSIHSNNESRINSSMVHHLINTISSSLFQFVFSLQNVNVQIIAIFTKMHDKNAIKHVYCDEKFNYEVIRFQIHSETLPKNQLKLVGSCAVHKHKYYFEYFTFISRSVHPLHYFLFTQTLCFAAR